MLQRISIPSFILPPSDQYGKLPISRQLLGYFGNAKEGSYPCENNRNYSGSILRPQIGNGRYGMISMLYDICNYVQAMWGLPGRRSLMVI